MIQGFFPNLLGGYIASVTGYEGIDKVGELLWAYSKTLELLTDECDSEYRNSFLDDLKCEIFNELALYKHGISPNDYQEISALCESVFNGQVFDDTSLEEFCEEFISRNSKAHHDL